MDMMTIINVFKQGAMNLSVPKLILGQSRTKIQSKKNKDKELSELMRELAISSGQKDKRRHALRATNTANHFAHRCPQP